MYKIKTSRLYNLKTAISFKDWPSISSEDAVTWGHHFRISFEGYQVIKVRNQIKPSKDRKVCLSIKLQEFSLILELGF